MADQEANRSIAARAAWLVTINHGTFRGWVRSILGELEFALGRLHPFIQTERGEVQRLVFVCLGNINRSAFAQAVAQDLGAHAASIGLSTTTGLPAFSMAVDVAPRYGLDLASHRATDFGDYVFDSRDLLLAMEVRHARELVRRGIPPKHIALLGHWARPHRIHIHDPHTLSEQYFRTCFAVLHSGVVNLVNNLRATGRLRVDR